MKSNLKHYGLSDSFPKRFFSKVKLTDSCWIWTGAKSGNGYGAIGKSGRGTGMIGAHVASWILHFGQIPEGHAVCHDCPGGDNKSCVNPAHLWIGTASANASDASLKGNLPSGEFHRNSKLTDHSVTMIRRRRNRGEKLIDIANDLGVTWRQVWNICNGRAWMKSKYIYA